MCLGSPYKHPPGNSHLQFPLMSKQESWVGGLDFKIQGCDCGFPEMGIRENPDYEKTRKGPYRNFGGLQVKFRLVLIRLFIWVGDP